MGCKTLVLLSRSGRVASGDAQLQQMFDALSSSGCTVHAWSCDVADGGKTKEMWKTLGRCVFPQGSYSVFFSFYMVVLWFSYVSFVSLGFSPLLLWFSFLKGLLHTLT